MGSGGGSAEIGDATAVLERAALEFRERLEGLHGVAWPMTVTQRFVGSLHRCEQQAVTELGDFVDEPRWDMFRGAALDAYVCHVIHSGPVADPVEDLRSFWIAADRPSELEDLDSLVADSRTAGVDRDARLADLADLSARAGVFSHVRSRFPRVEVSIAPTLAATIRLPGRVDVMLGGPGTPAASVLIEVKSGRPHAEHTAQLRHYLLLAALVHGELPTAAAVWYPGGGEAGAESVTLEVPVPGAVSSSARRVAGVVGLLAELWEGRVPGRRGGPHCNWCPLSGECAEATVGRVAQEAADAE